MRSYRMTRGQRLVSDIRYFFRNNLGDLAAAVATFGIIILAPVIMLTF